MKSNLTILLILLIGLSVRLISYTESFWLDEAAQAAESCRPLSEQLNISSDFQPPLYHLIVHGFCQFSQSEWWLRLSSLIPGLITIYFTILIGKKLFSDHAGYIAGIILSLSQFHAFYSQELRPYSLTAMFGVISIYCLLKYINNPNRLTIYYYLLTTVLGLYTTYVYWVLPLSVIIYLYFTKSSNLKPILIASSISLLSLFPWMPMFFSQLSIGRNLAGTSEVWRTSVSPALIKMLPLAISKLTIGRIPFDLNIQTIIIATISLFTFGIILYRSYRHKSFLIPLYLFLLPIIIAYTVSFFVPILDPKRVLFVLPFWCLMLAAGIKLNLKSIVALVVLLNISIYSLAIANSNLLTRREPWRQVVTDIKSAYQSGDVVIQIFNEPFAPWSWYAKDSMNVIATVNPSELSLRLSASPPLRLFVFDYLLDITDPNRNIYSVLNQIGYHESIVHNYPLIGAVRLYELDLQKLTASKY